MKRIIHISDLHIGYKDFHDRFNFIIETLIFEKGDKARDYVIVMTGDLSDNANKEIGYRKAKEGIDFLDQAGFSVLVVPGNHDYGSGDLGKKKFVRLFQKNFFGKETGFPKKDIIGEIAFIGLDSMAEELNWYDAIFAEGELGQKQLKGLEIILHEEDVRACRKRVIYLHHHPFSPRPVHYLKDSKMLKAILNGAMKEQISIDAILFGHNHQGLIHNGQWGITRCYDAGTATLKPRPKYLGWCPWFQVRSSTRVIDLENDNVHADYVLPMF